MADSMCIITLDVHKKTNCFLLGKNISLWNTKIIVTVLFYENCTSGEV